MNSPTPTSILVRDPETNRSWYLDTATPTADMVTLGQLGCGLESIRRFGGYTVRPITVAEHSMRVGRFARALVQSSGWVGIPPETWTGPVVSPLLASAAYLVGLIHDAPEAITGRGDVLRPAKTAADREAEARAYESIVDHLFGPLGPLWHLAPTGWVWVRQALVDVAEVVHTADNLALYYEAMLWQPGAVDWVPPVVRDPMPDVMLPLVWPRDGERWADAVRETCAEVAAAARAL